MISQTCCGICTVFTKDLALATNNHARHVYERAVLIRGEIYKSGSRCDERLIAESGGGEILKTH